MRRYLTFAVFCLGLPFGTPAAEVKIVGSDLLRSALEKPLAGAKVDDARVLRLRLDGSLGALDEVRAGRADLAVVAIASNEAPPEGAVRLIPLAYQVAVVAVNDENPLRQMSLEQLGGVFGDKEPTDHRQWGSLGLTNAWAEKSIVANLVADPDSLALDLFRHAVLHVPELKPTVAQQPSFDELLRRVRVDETCIGMLPRPLTDSDGVRVLLIARSDRDVPFGPTAENVHNGDYPLRLPFFIALKAERAVELAPVLERLLGDEVATALEQAGFVAVPAAARLHARRELGTKPEAPQP